MQETEFNEFMLVGLGLGLASIVAIGMMVYCRRYKRKKLRRREHPMLPAHSHFHTCESIGGCDHWVLLTFEPDVKQLFTQLSNLSNCGLQLCTAPVTEHSGL
jgi:hypothetical protein